MGKYLFILKSYELPLTPVFQFQIYLLVPREIGNKIKTETVWENNLTVTREILKTTI